MRTCDETLELISAALDGPLTTEEQTALNEHLAHCPACSALYTDLSELHIACSELEEIPAPDGFADRVMAHIAADPAQNQPNNVIPFSAKPAAILRAQSRAAVTSHSGTCLLVLFNSIILHYLLVLRYMHRLSDLNPLLRFPG